MIVYHGSSTLPLNIIPKAAIGNGVFLSPQKEFSQIFGRTIHIFEIDESSLLDLRIENHKEKIKHHPLYKSIEIEESSGLPFAFNHVTKIEALDAIKTIAQDLGYCGALFFETSSALGIEVWNTSCLTYLGNEDNPRFDELNE